MKKLILWALLSCFSLITAQTELVFVYFKDKPNAATFLLNPTSEISIKSIERRAALNIPITEQDAPIEVSYLQNIKNLGFTVTDFSKWLNGVAVNATPSQIIQLQNLPYVLQVESFVKNNTTNKNKSNKKFPNLSQSKTAFNYGNSLEQIDQINLRALHLQGFTGSGISIAVIDTGFPTVDTGLAFARMRNNNQIKDTYNFIDKNNDVYNNSLNSHGTNCLGIIGGYLDGNFVGAAPDASFYLYATENENVEIPEEELYWIEAAEEADRKGVDIITSSLGYNIFDDAKYDYSYADMTGTKSFIARGAQIATEKGIIVLIAAGNEGNNSWKYITTPADNEKVFTIGAVDALGKPSFFTSYGPNAEGKIKPDASSRGTSTYYAYNNGWYYGNGTSYATPLAAGGVACLLQAIPKETNRDEIKNQLRQQASLAPQTSDRIGYGILNFGKTLSTYLNTTTTLTKNNIAIYPNPVQNEVHIISSAPIENISIYNQVGQLLWNTSSTTIPVQQLPKGIYYLKIKTKEETTIETIIK